MSTVGSQRRPYEIKMSDVLMNFTFLMDATTFLTGTMRNNPYSMTIREGTTKKPAYSCDAENAAYCQKLDDRSQ